MKWIILILIGVHFTFCSEDVTESIEETSEESGREMREFNPDSRRAVEPLPFEWMPKDEVINHPKPKRRRLRKRKRRPIVQTYQEDYTEIITNRPMRRRIRPYRLEQDPVIQDDWQQEEPQKPNIRRRLTPEEITREDDTENNPISDLKTLLKQSRGELSLSEILQQNNLSLPELLSGNEKGISVLTEAPLKHTSEEIQNSPNQETTDRRIFVPSHPKYYTSMSYKPEFSQSKQFETTTEADNQKQINVAMPIKIQIKQVAGFKKLQHMDPLEPAHMRLNKTEQTLDEPMRVPIDLNAFPNKTEAVTEIPLENVTLVTAREEIMEILKDPISRERLSRVLQHRNMTVDELVQQRERGSSQVHLADIFHNKTREPEPKGEPFVGKIEESIKPKEGLVQVVTVIPFGLKIDDFKPKAMIETEKPPPPPPLKEEMILVESNPWTKFKSEILSVPLYPSQIPKLTTKDYFFNDIPRLEEVDNIFSSSSTEELNVDEDTEPFLNIPSGVKSAIFVSLAIIGLSILVFLTILLIFKWSQKQTKTINYCSSLSSRFRSPIILQARQTNALRTFVNETLGRKKNYYKSNVQRMCDDIWEGGAEKKMSY